MFCKKCGSTLRDNAKFCGSCGAVVEVADAKGNNFSYTAPVQQNNGGYTAPVQQNNGGYTAPVQNAYKAPAQQNNGGYTAPVQNAYKAPAQQGNDGRTVPVQKKLSTIAQSVTKIDVSGIVNKVPKKMLPIIGGAAVVVLVLILLITGVFGGASGKVMKAFSKSLDAYADVAADLNLPDVLAIAEKGKWNQEVKLWFEDGADELEGVGVRFALSYNQSGKEAAMIVAPYFEDTDLLTAQMKLKGSKIYLGCPELMEKTYVMIDTKTIGQDLADKDLDGMEDLSFNIFTLIEQIEEASALPKDQQKAIEKAGAALVKAIEVEKDGKDDIRVNGKKLSCTVYNVVIPQDAIEDYLDVLEDVIKDMDGEAAMDVLEEAGFPVDEMYISTGNEDMLDAIDELKDMIDEIGDIEMQVGINKGYVVSIVWEYSMYGTDYEANVQLGGGDNYVDDLSVEMLTEDDYGTRITSSGNHAMKKGVFTDETTIARISNGDEYEYFVSELSWEPKAKEDNFEWTLSEHGDEFSVEGTVRCTKDSLTVTLPECEIDGVSLGIGYTLGDYKAPSIKMGETLAFADMDEDDMEDLLELIEENGSEWAEMIEDEYEGLYYFMMYMF